MFLNRTSAENEYSFRRRRSKPMIYSKETTMKKLIAITLLLAISLSANAGVPSFPVTPEWTAKIEKLAPEKPTAEPVAKRKALLFSLMTGFKHWVTPHTAEVVKVLGEKSGAFEVLVSDDPEMFSPENIKQFNLIILNNNCSNGKYRDLFRDATGDVQKAAMLEKSLIDHIAAGNGLVAIHGSIVMQNNSAAFSEMLGGSFDYHPAQCELSCTLVDPKHPLVAAFEGEPLVHTDEPYFFNNAYKDKNFRPLLEMDTSTMDAKSQSDKRYVAWIKKHGAGRVFYCSPSHNAQSFENPKLLRFLLDGIQYAAGDLPCEDSPLK